MLDRATLKRLWPKAPAATISAVAKIADDVFAEFGLTDTLTVAHFMAQISHECGAGTIIRENMNYSAERMVEIFGVGHHSAAVTEGEARRLAHKPQQIAERVYGLGNPKKAKELGNTQPGDGWRCRGGGMLQLTGGDAYRKFGAIAGVDLYADPDAIADPEISFRVAVAEFVALGCLPYARKDDVRMVSRRVNGGTNGLAERIVWLKKWKAALDDMPELAAAKPRGADEAPGVIKTLATSKIAVGTAAVVVPVAGDALNTAADTASQVASIKNSADDAGITTMLMHLASNPRFLIAVAVIVVLGLVIYWRWRDHG